ncbi:MAG: TonB-dependent receptor [Roseivirga sp.]|nr:TonB-dependent receptor [Roseivirga sp.]
MKTAATLIGIFMTSLLVQGQSFTFLDESTGKKLEDALVSIEEVNSGRVYSAITNRFGVVSFDDINFPVIILARHLSYNIYQDTLSSSKPYSFKLTPVVNQLEDFVVTGQFSAQSATRSVFSVKVIDKDQIQARNAVSLSEALNNSLNIRLSEDLALGSSTASLLGVSGQNIKILLDGIPLVNRNGNGNNADLSQINLSLIERIEIVEGPMAVNYGANALAGVINLITKTEVAARSEVTFSLLEESAGNEYSLDAGKHVQNLTLSHRLSSGFSARLGLQHNDFAGFRGSATPRQYEWNPKRQWQTNGLVRYARNKYQVHYRLDYLNELISDFGSPQNNFLPGGENQPFAIDEEYLTRRFIHQLQFQTKESGKNQLNGFFSYSDFKRDKSRFANNLQTGAQNLTTGAGDQDRSTYKVFESGATFTSSFSDKLRLQSGYQLTFETVGGGRISNKKQALNNVAVYSSFEWNPAAAITIRPGARFAHNSSFGSQLIPSLQAKFDLNDETEIRAAYGRGFRAPSVRELYFEFVDTNHRIFGNPGLQPEFSHYFSLNVQRSYSIGAMSSKTELNSFFNSINNQIGLAQSAIDATAVSYININRFKTLGATLVQKLESSRLSLSLGFSYIGRYNNLPSLGANDLKQFFFTPEANISFSYSLPSSLRLNLFYKYSGRLQSYITTTGEDGNEEISTGAIEGYHWLDFNMSRSLSKRLELGLGVKNLLDIQRINNSGVASGTHSGGGNLPISYGRSYFLKLNYNLKIDD